MNHSMKENQPYNTSGDPNSTNDSLPPVARYSLVKKAAASSGGLREVPGWVSEGSKKVVQVMCSQESTDELLRNI